MVLCPCSAVIAPFYWMLFGLAIIRRVSPAALKMKALSVNGGRRERSFRVWHGSAVPVCLCTGICTRRHKGPSVEEETHKASLALDSASLIAFIRPLCLPSSDFLLSCYSFLFSSQLHLYFSLFAVFWLNYSWEFIVPNGRRTDDTEGFISFGPCLQCCVFVGTV